MDDHHNAQDGNVACVDETPEQGSGDRFLVVVHGRRIRHPDPYMMSQHVDNGCPERAPIGIQGQQWKDDEEMEVGLDQPAREVDEDA
jgi:hypothetical protein